MRLLARIVDLIVNAMAWFGCLLIIFMALSISYQVVMRYFFNVPPMWVNDFVEYSLLWATFLGAAYVLREERHIEVDLVIGILNQKYRILMKIITSFIGVAICLVLAWYGILTVWDNYQRKVTVLKAMESPKYIILMPIFIGSFFLAIQFFLRAQFYLTERKRNTKEHGEKKESEI